METANLKPVRSGSEYNKPQDIQPDIMQKPEMKPLNSGSRNPGRNFKLGLATVITGYFAFAFYILTIFGSIRFMQNGTMAFAYAMIAVLLMMVTVSGIFFLISLTVNIKETKAIHHVSRGLVLTFISIPPIALCYLAFFIKALTENH